jgi:hypothetical protein
MQRGRFVRYDRRADVDAASYSALYREAVAVDG